MLYLKEMYRNLYNAIRRAMDNGFFDSMLDEVYGFLKICLVVLLWNVIPIIYTRYVHKKAKTE